MDVSVQIQKFPKKPEKKLFLPDDRVYTTFQELIAKEKQLPENVRIDFVAIVTPNHLHFEPAVLALQNGFHVMLDKPLTFSLDEAHKLKAAVESSKLLFGLTHTYTGYPMVKEARLRVQRGDFGVVRRIYVEYPQGWLSQDVNTKQAAWRVDPTKSGKAGCMGDIGTHAYNLAEYITGLKAVEVCAELNTFVKGRLLDDDGVVMIRYENGARGLLAATQIAAGEGNDLFIRVYGDRGGLEWHQETPNTLVLKWNDRPRETLVAAAGYTSPLSQHSTRTPPNHPEGYLEAFANIYRNFANALQCRLNNVIPPPEFLDFPGIDDGLKGMQFIETVVASSASTEKWVKLIQ